MSGPVILIFFCTIFIDGRLAVLNNLKCMQLNRELNNKKDRVKMTHYVLF